MLRHLRDGVLRIACYREGNKEVTSVADTYVDRVHIVLVSGPLFEAVLNRSEFLKESDETPPHRHGMLTKKWRTSENESARNEWNSCDAGTAAEF